MTHEKKKSVLDDLLKYWPLIMVVFISITGYITLGNTVQAQAKDIVRLQDDQASSAKDATEQKVTTAKMSAQLDYIVEAIKESRGR